MPEDLASSPTAWKRTVPRITPDIARRTYAKLVPVQKSTFPGRILAALKMILDSPGMSGGLGGKNKAVWRILGSLQASEAHSAAASGEDIDGKWLRAQLSR